MTQDTKHDQDAISAIPDGGSVGSGPALHLNKEIAIQKLPCNGVRCFTLKGVRGSERYAYSVAYDGIFIASGCKVGEDGSRKFTREGIRRLTLLNQRYMMSARPFIEAELKKCNAELEGMLLSAERIGSVIRRAKEGAIQ